MLTRYGTHLTDANLQNVCRTATKFCLGHAKALLMTRASAATARPLCGSFRKPSDCLIDLRRLLGAQLAVADQRPSFEAAISPYES